VNGLLAFAFYIEKKYLATISLDEHFSNEARPILTEREKQNKTLLDLLQ
jgi:hypothetical protein